MAKYELKPDNVDAVHFNGKNWFHVEQMLGPHLTKKKEGDVLDSASHDEFFVFDVASKIWKPVPQDTFVVRHEDGCVEVIKTERFKDTWQEAKAQPSLFPTYPNHPNFPPFGPTYGQGVR